MRVTSRNRDAQWDTGEQWATELEIERGAACALLASASRQRSEIRLAS